VLGAVFRRKYLVPLVVSIAVFLLTMFIISVTTSNAGEQARYVTTPSAVVPVSPPLSGASSVAPSQDSSSSPSAGKGNASSLTGVPAPADTEKFSIAVGNPKASVNQCPMPVAVYRQHVEANQPVTMPEPFGQNDWCGTSVWLSNAKYHWVYPSSPSKGITYVAMHSCGGSYQCPLTFVQSKPPGSARPYTVSVGQRIVVTTPTGILTYRVCAIGHSPKHDNNALQIPPGCGHVDLVVGNCDNAVDYGELYNNVLAARLIDARPR
jgi:hypothetical protein